MYLCLSLWKSINVLITCYLFLLFQVLAVPMLAPRSYTREDVIELQCHGSEVCLHRVLRACLEAGARLAEPGWLLLIRNSFQYEQLFVVKYC